MAFDVNDVTSDAGEREREREQREQHALAHEFAACEQEARDRRQHERRERDACG